MQIETERLLLRPFQESDAASVYLYGKDPKVGPSAGWPIHTSEENSLEIIKTILMKPETYAITRKQEPEKAIGAISLLDKESSNIALESNEAEVGYWLGVPFWGQGYMPEELKALVQYVFENSLYRKIWGGYF